MAGMQALASPSAAFQVRQKETKSKAEKDPVPRITVLNITMPAHLPSLTLKWLNVTCCRRKGDIDWVTSKILWAVYFFLMNDSIFFFHEDTQQEINHSEEKCFRPVHRAGWGPMICLERCCLCGANAPCVAHTAAKTYFRFCLERKRGPAAHGQAQASLRSGGKQPAFFFLLKEIWRISRSSFHRVLLVRTQLWALRRNAGRTCISSKEWSEQRGGH